jgi:hypothetical protein
MAAKPGRPTKGKDEATGRFLPGNRFWEARSSHGRKPIFSSPDDLWTACEEYFAWVEATPLYEAKAFAHQGHVTFASLPKMRAMTIEGLCIFLDISRQTWSEYRNRPDFADITVRVEEVIRSQKFAGAAADLLNASIIARDLGLAEKNEHSGPDGGPIQTEVSARDVIAGKLAGLAARKSEGGDTGGADGSTS